MVEIECENPKCNITFERTNFEFKRSRHHYCSRSCSTQVNNIKFPKRSMEGSCVTCGKAISKRNKYCNNCTPNYVDWSAVTLKEIRDIRRYQVHSRIRNLARKAYINSTRIKACEYCGYSNFFEICHIRPIYLFDDNTPISIINDQNNLIALCPNHHRELDNGIISLDSICAAGKNRTPDTGGRSSVL